MLTKASGGVACCGGVLIVCDVILTSHGKEVVHKLHCCCTDVILTSCNSGVCKCAVCVEESLLQAGLLLALL